MKAEQLVIETPEKIVFTYNIAELGTRMAAYLIDILIQTVLLFLFALLVGLSAISLENLDEDNLLYYAAVLFIMLFLFQWGYFLFFESIMNGRTPGKKVCRVRVIRFDGERLDFPSLAVRNLLRAADSLPLPYLNVLGGFVAMLNRQNRRLGDLVAGTVVVSDSVFSLTEPDFETRLAGAGSRRFARPSERERLSEKDLYILRRLLNEQSRMPPETFERTLAEVAAKLRQKYDLSPGGEMDDMTIIEEVYKAHTYEDQE